MSGLVGPDGQPITTEGKPQPFPGLDLRNPVQTLDLLGTIARGGYIMAQQYGALAGPKGERHVKVEARQVSILSSQVANVAEFASNALAELTFSLSEAEARIAVLRGQLAEDKVQAAAEADMTVSTEWENRRRLFSLLVPITLKKRKTIGQALADVVMGPPLTEEDFEKVRKEADELGLIKNETEASEATPAQEAAAEAFQEMVPASDPSVADQIQQEEPQNDQSPPKLQVVDGGQS